MARVRSKLVTERVVILCGGKGMRAYPTTAMVPKPLIEVGARPVVQHVMDIYAGHGYRDFVLAAGYKRELIESFGRTLDPEWNVDVVDTGQGTNTGERVRAVADVVSDTFFVTYADGLGNIDVPATLDFHRAHGGLVTMTTVPLPSQYGVVDFDVDGRVRKFRERPMLQDHFINAGFLVFDRRCFDVWPSTGDDLERDVLTAFAEAGELFAYKHSGYWKSLDTHKDALELNAACAAGQPPWAGPLR